MRSRTTAAKHHAVAGHGDDDGAHLEIERPYTNFSGTRSYWRANAAARLAAVLMDAEQVPYGFAYPGEAKPGWGGSPEIWMPRADVQRIEGPNGTIVVCGMR